MIEDTTNTTAEEITSTEPVTQPATEEQLKLPRLPQKAVAPSTEPQTKESPQTPPRSHAVTITESTGIWCL